MPESPICAYCRKRPAAADWLPFCSERCKMADLGRWLSGGYRVPGAELESPADDADHNDDEP
jgi:endogenous inhibitor of DNA gyrase (YacG/DUF329 family)